MGPEYHDDLVRVAHETTPKVRASPAKRHMPFAECVGLPPKKVLKDKGEQHSAASSSAGHAHEPLPTKAEAIDAGHAFF